MKEGETMIKDLKDPELYFKDSKELIKWLKIDDDNAHLLNNCKTEEDYISFANEYILKVNDGIVTHDFRKERL